MLSSRIVCLWPVGAVLGEGLAYELDSQLVWFVDIKCCRLYCVGLSDGRRRSWSLPSQVSALAIPPSNWSPKVRGDHVLLSVGQRGFAWLLIVGGEAIIEPIAHPEADIPGNRFNDGKLGPDRRFYAGTMDDSETRASGSLYVLDCDGNFNRLDGGFGVTNGPAFSADGQTLYENDSLLRRTYAYDLARDGRLSNKRVFHQFSASDGFPDGMTVDEDGFLWIAMWDGSKIQRLSSKGQRAGCLNVPVQRPTNCMFVDSKRLVFTSAVTGIENKGKMNGGIFLAHL